MYKKAKLLFKGNQKLVITLILSITAFTFFISSKPADEVSKYAAPQMLSSNTGETFLIGMMGNGEDADFKYIDDTLGFNLWHIYPGSETIGGKHYPTGWTANDKLFTEGGTYVTEVRTVLDNIEGHNMKTLMERPKIEYLCYGQRSDYQCESMESLDDQNYWFYTFQSNQQGHTHTGHDWRDSSIYGENQMVKYCRINNSTNGGDWTDGTGYVVDRLRTNSEQCHKSSGFDAYRWDSECDWLIKPRVRIDSTVADNPANLENEVFRIDIYNQSGYNMEDPAQNRMKSTIIKVRNFLDQYGNYNGRYLEEFRYNSGDSILTMYQRDWATSNEKWWYTARVNHTQDNNDDNHADIQVYWYGNCDMWIDYVRVDNDIADELLKGGHWGMYDRWIKEFADSADVSKLVFNLAEFELNYWPCIGYVAMKIKEYSNGRIKIIALK